MPIRGVNAVRSILADGSVVWRYYTYRGAGADCFWTEKHRPIKKPYPTAFVKAYVKAVEAQNEIRDNFDGLARRYLASPEFKKLAERTQQESTRAVERACEEFKNTPLSVIADPRFRAAIIAYRDSRSASPRAADHAVQAVSSVLQHARNLGLLGSNPAMGIPSLYSAPSDKRPWTQDEIDTFTTGCPTFILDAFWLIRHFALRRADAAAITWPADKGTHIAWKTSKSGKQREAVIPILPAGRAFLDDIRLRNGVRLAGLVQSYARKHKDVTPIQTASRFMLLKARGAQWDEASSITKAFAKRWKALGVKDFPSPHRLRNNAATAYLIAGLDERTVADAMGWTLTDVEDMRRVYVDREAVVSAAVIRLRDRT